MGLSFEEVRQRLERLRRDHLPAIMALLETVPTEVSGADSTLARMCTYHMATGGKRVRALLPLLVADVVGAEPSRLVPFGAACEMLHNASLVHDDLQDGDHLRRGQQTVWHRFGPQRAINLGDAMLYYALMLVQRLEVAPPLRETIYGRVFREVVRVIEGQEREFSLKQLPRPNLEDYYAMVEGKTAALFALPMAGAATLCGAPPPLISALEQAARHMGVLFQIQDDVLDLYGDKGRAERGNDIREGKRSLLVVHALGASSPAEARWLREVLDKEREATAPEEIAKVLALFERRDSLQFALAEISQRKQRASAGLLDQPELRSIVEALCEMHLEPIQNVAGGIRTGRC